MYPETTSPLERNDQYPYHSKCIYLISTTSNNISDSNDINHHINTNLTILIDRLKACLDYNVKEFNFISSWFVYGPPTFSTSTYGNGLVHIPVYRETDPCNPRGFYSITKYTAEQLVREFCESYGIKWRILRLANVYGYDQGANKNKNILHYLVQKLKDNKDVSLYGYYRPAWRDYIHIYDACRAIKYVCDNAPSQNIYNIGCGPANAVNMKVVMETAKDYIESSSTIEFIPTTTDKLGNHIEMASLSIDKLSTTGFKAQIPFQLGLKDLCKDLKFSIPDHIGEMKKLVQQFQT
jgi:nucleoside-diphosphate-sugar epimerase